MIPTRHMWKTQSSDQGLGRDKIAMQLDHRPQAEGEDAKKK